VEWINAPAVWAQGYDGTGVLVGHLDSGAWLQHPDLVNRLWVNPDEIPGNEIDDDRNGYVDDVHGWDFGDRDSDPTDDGFAFAGGGHGTHTAGTVCGDGSGGLSTGVAPGAKIIVCKPTWTELGTASFEAIAEAQQYAVAMGARLLTMSLGAVGGMPAAVLQAERFVGDHLRLLGVPLITSAGNAHGQLSPPVELTGVARVPSPWNENPFVPYSSRSGVISVGATAFQSNAIWNGSSQGPADWAYILPWDDWDFSNGEGLVKPDVSAPGEGISSLIRPSGYSQTNWTGTSMACPHVSGVAALMLQKNPSLMPKDIDRILQQTAVDLGDPGKDNVFGSGRIDALAAVNAVPSSGHPSLVITNVEIADANGNGSIDPGEEFDLALEVTNNSFTVGAETVTAFLSVPNDPLITVLDQRAQFPEIAPRQAAVHDLDPLRLRASSDAEQGRVFRIDVALTAAGAYSTTIDLTLFVGLPEMRTHRTQAIQVTVTDRGTLGYWAMNQMQGDGIGPLGESLLFAGGFWGGTGHDYICNRDYVPTDPTEWELVTEPNGRLAWAEYPVADEHFVGMFSDLGHAQPRHVEVMQESLSWMDEEAADFVILRYTIRNSGTEPLVGYRAALFCDWDFEYPFYTRSGVDATRDLVYTNDVYITGEHAGVRVLTPGPNPTLAVIHNPTYVHENLQILDRTKWEILNGSLDGYVGDADDDYSNLAAASAVDVAPGATRHFAFAIVYGETLEDLQANADLALQRFQQNPTTIRDVPARGSFVLEQNTPNPFNPSTSIHFSLNHSGLVRLSILDVKGRVVRRLIQSPLPAGPHQIRWNGVDDLGQQVSSGVYLYRLETAEGSATRKMILVK
jgi:subtilisin family serine protease